MGANAESLSTTAESSSTIEAMKHELRAANVRLVTSSSSAEARARSEARERVEALTIRESHGETRTSGADNHLVKGGLVSSTSYILERVFRDHSERPGAMERLGWRPRTNRA
jgi:hypothetical protein